MNVRKILAVGCLVLAGSVSQAAAGSCGYTYCWGAVGIGADGSFGWSHSHRSEGLAIQAAQDGCKGRCSEIKTFYNTCGAIAVSDNGAWGFGWHENQELASDMAVDYCQDNGYNCRVQVWACSK